MESRAKVEPGSGKHSVHTHFPKDPNCDICLKTKPNEKRLGIPFKGPVVPFGLMVEYHPISARDLSRVHQIGPKV